MHKRRIDTHAHMVPDFYREWLEGLGIESGGLPIPRWDADNALKFMDEEEIETSILSVSTPGVEPALGMEACEMARRLNEFSAALHLQRPERFGFFATLPLPNLEGSVEEAVYALDILHADGIALHARAGGRYLGDPFFDPLLTELNARKATIFVHPSSLPEPGVPGLPAYVADFLLDTVRAAANLCKTGAMDRFQDLKILLSHGGGFLPYAAARMAARVSPLSNQEDGIRLLRRFYLDTALTSSSYALPSLLAFADPMKLTFGSDFPYAKAERSKMFTAELDRYNQLDHQSINRENAVRVFGRFSIS